MNIQQVEITVREIAEQYSDTAEGGVFGYNGKLNIRPPFQREFVYKDKQRDAVVETIMKGFPLNTMYWSKNSDGTFEVLDGQQRTISICQYVHGAFSVMMDGKPRMFFNLPNDVKERILSYKLMIYVCEGSESEKLDWFRIINIAGEKLTEQELRNAVYTGSWLASAKKYFSKSQCVAYQIGSKYLNGSPIRQDYLETALDWMTDGHIEQYMAEHQNDPNANQLWDYFQQVIGWIERLFPTYRSKLMKGLPWGNYYNKFKGTYFDKDALESKICALMEDEEVTSQKGIYPYVLTGEEKHLSLRAFTPKQSQLAYHKQKGICPHCKKKFQIEEMEADHIIPWSQGGKTDQDNCQMLCRKCNRTKSDN